MMSTFFVPIGKEIGVCWGTEHLQVFRRRAFLKALPLRSGRDQKDLNLDSSCLFRKGGGGRPPPTERESLPFCLRLLREQRSFARLSGPPQSFEPPEYRLPLSPRLSALLDSCREDRLPRPLSCPKD